MPTTDISIISVNPNEGEPGTVTNLTLLGIPAQAQGLHFSTPVWLGSKLAINEVVIVDNSTVIFTIPDQATPIDSGMFDFLISDSGNPQNNYSASGGNFTVKDATQKEPSVSLINPSRFSFSNISSQVIRLTGENLHLVRAVSFTSTARNFSITQQSNTNISFRIFPVGHIQPGTYRIRLNTDSGIVSVSKSIIITPD